MKRDKAIFSIGTAAKLLEVHPRTLRIYEKEGLIKPVRRGSRRYYSMDNIQWINCLRKMIHEKGLNIAGVKEVLKYAPCWSVVGCPPEVRAKCTAYLSAVDKNEREQ